MIRLSEQYPDRLEARYKFTPPPGADGMQLLELAAKTRGFILPGGVFDLRRMSVILLDEFRGGKLGRVSLELPEEL